MLGNAAPLPPPCSVLPVPPSSPPPRGVCPAAAGRAGGGTGLGTGPRQAAQLQPAARGAHCSAHCDGTGRAARQPLSPQQGECGQEQQVAGDSGWAGGGTPALAFAGQETEPEDGRALNVSGTEGWRLRAATAFRPPFCSRHWNPIGHTLLSRRALAPCPACRPRACRATLKAWPAT